MSKKGIPSIDELFNENITKRNELEKCYFNPADYHEIKDIEKCLKKYMEISVTDKSAYKHKQKTQKYNINKNIYDGLYYQDSKTDISNDTLIVNSDISKNKHKNKQKPEGYNNKKNIYHTGLVFKEVQMQEIEEIIIEKANICIIYGNLCIWNGHYYRQLNRQQFAQEVRKLIPPDKQKQISRYSRINEAYEYMLANDNIKNKFTDKQITISKRMIVFNNGMYDARKNKLYELSSSYPVIFKVDADYIGERNLNTENMDKVINNASGNDEEVLELFYQVLGYIISQGIDAKKFFVFATASDSGKSIIGEFLGRLLGEDNIATIPLNNLGSRFAIGSIQNKILNYNMDLPDQELDNNSVQRLKQLTGDSKIDCEEKYVQSKTIEHHCKFLFASNHPIRLKYKDDAFYERLVLVPFIYSASNEEKDYNLPQKLWKERHAIATKAALAYHQLCNNNYTFKKPYIAESMINEWRNDGINYFYQKFWEEKCELEYGQFLPTDIAFKEFQNFCIEYGKVIYDEEKINFSKTFRKLFNLENSKKRVKGYSSPVHGYIGVKLK